MNNNTVSALDWLKILMIICIPIVNIVFLLYWAFGPQTFKTNFAKAYLAIIVIAIGIAFALFSINFENISDNTVDNYHENLAKLYETNDKVLVRDYAIDDLNILDTQINQSNYGASVTFIIENQSNVHNNIWLDLGFYDSQNILLDTTSIKLVKIPPGNTYQKEEFFSSVDVENIDEATVV